MKISALSIVLLAACGAFLWAAPAQATETENFGLAVLPAPGSVTVDGRSDDWDLTGGMFICGDVETMRDTHSLWYHAMYDADYLYLLGRFNDPTPLNNPGVTSGDLGFQGDCLQTRVITAFNQPDEKVTHLTCWRGKDGRDVIKVELGRLLHDGTITDLKTQGAKQAFSVSDDGKHYLQEIAIPWAQLATGGKSPGPGGEVRLAVEANFTIGTNSRMTIKDSFQPGLATVDRVFTFRAVTQWGTGKLERTGHLAPRPVRLSDGREFAVHIEGGLPAVDWTGLVKKNEAAGFKSIPFDMPVEGYASVVLRAADGTVVRHLLNCQPLTKGRHELKWDGLTTPNWKRPGEPVAAGTYQLTALYHSGIGLKLKGWAGGGAQTPWDYPAQTGNWGGDHGTPTTAAADQDQVYLGWSTAEAGKALVVCDLDGNVLWHHSRGGIGGARAIAVDGDTVYVVDREPVIYRLGRKSGQYTTWQGSDSAELELTKVFENYQQSRDDRFSLAGGGGKLYLGSKLADQVVVIDSATGAVLKRLSVAQPLAVALSPQGRLFVLSEGTKVLNFGSDLASPQTLVDGLTAATSIALDPKGQIYVGLGEPDNQVKIFSADGKAVKAIGTPGGRALEGPWTPQGLRFVDGITVDAAGKLWVMENDWSPKRVSVWNVDSGKLVLERFGAAAYGAPGGAICPDDPLFVVGTGCEFQIDSKTGLAACTAVITRGGMEGSRFATAHGRTYLFVVSTESGAVGPLRIFERLGPGQYKLRTELIYVDEAGKELPPSKHGKPSGCKQTVLWADANDDQKRQPEEMTAIDGELRVSGWFPWITPDGALYSKEMQFKVQGLTACGAPRYDLAHPFKMPAAGIGSADGRLVFTFNKEGQERAWNRVIDIASGKQLFEYPDTYVGVHGSHNAPAPEIGLIRGAFPPCGVAKLPEPIGNIWVIPTNVGEWHILTEHGYYLTRLFQPDPLKVKWPEVAAVDTRVDEIPSGAGGEDFGGSATLAKNGKLYIEAGKTAFWDLEVVGLDQVKSLSGASVTIDEADIALAQKMREDYLQATAAVQPLFVKKVSPQFTGNLDKDFAGANFLKFQKQEDARVRSTAAWDDQNLYLGWDVSDSTPWINGATDRELMFVGGDTVDFQLGTDPKADPKRSEGARGDLRLSIGPFQKKAQAILYRRVADDPHPRSFSSGVFKDYVMQSVLPLDSAEVFTKTLGKDRYVVEVKVPLAALGLTPRAGLELHGDFGVTHGDPAGQRTRLRTYWANQHTGIVDDVVAELKMEPRLWGTLILME